jgi:hypothetical protein
MRHLGGKFLPMLGLWFVVGALAGCVNGPFYRMWYQKQWDEDEKYGPTFYTRLDELQVWRNKAKSMSADEQARVAQQLTQALAQDSCSTYRSEVVRTLAVFTTPAAMDGLRLAIKDKEPSVRTVACHALGKHRDRDALQALSEVVVNDQNRDVRMAAARELGDFKEQEAVRALGLALEDTDPALQHLAVQSLRSVTGKDFGDSVPAWRQFVRGEQVKPGEQPSLAERLRRLF